MKGQFAMQSFDVAHRREQGVDLIIVFVDERVGRTPDSDQGAIMSRLTLCARNAGLAGSVLLWRGGFVCDRRFRAFFESAPYELLATGINRKLTCNNL